LRNPTGKRNSGLKNPIEHIETSTLTTFQGLRSRRDRVMQPIHLPLDVNEKVFPHREERCKYEWPFKTMLGNGATLAFGRFPVADTNPSRTSRLR
jgi:predicted amidohydrolase YtcJ